MKRQAESKHNKYESHWQMRVGEKKRIAGQPVLLFKQK